MHSIVVVVVVVVLLLLASLLQYNRRRNHAAGWLAGWLAATTIIEIIGTHTPASHSFSSDGPSDGGRSPTDPADISASRRIQIVSTSRSPPLDPLMRLASERASERESAAAAASGGIWPRLLCVGVVFGLGRRWKIDRVRSGTIGNDCSARSRTSPSCADRLRERRGSPHPPPRAESDVAPGPAPPAFDRYACVRA